MSPDVMGICKDREILVINEDPAKAKNEAELSPEQELLAG